MVSLGAGQTRVYDPGDLRPPSERRLGDLAHDAPVHRGVANDALSAPRPAPPRTAASRARAPASRAPRAAAPAAAPIRTEMNDTSQVTSCRRERQLLERPGVRPLEHRHARVVAEPRVELPVADVERDHARGAALEQDVREPAGRGAEVEAVEARRIDAERVERVGELEPGARDVRRRASRPRAAPPRRPARRASRGRGRAPP